MHIILLCLALFFSPTIWAADGEITTEVNASGGASYFYEEHHPVKFDFKTFTFCGGRQAKAEFDQDEDSKLKSTNNSGLLNLFNTIDGKKNNQSKVLNQSLSWDSTFDHEDYSFNVVIKKTKGVNQNFQKTNVCNTRNWHYRIDKSTSSVNTSVNLVVPANVYIVEIEKVVNDPKIPNFRVVAEKVYSAVPSVNEKNREGLIMKKQEQVNLNQNLSLFFVNPGEEINLAVMFKDEGDNTDISANTKVTFFGYNRCSSNIANAFKSSGRRPEDGINALMIQQYFDADFSAGSKENVMTSKAREGLNFLGCLTSQDTIKSILYQQDITQIQSILESVAQFSNKINDDLKNSSGDQSQFLLFLSTVELMARQALSQSLLNVMKPMCELMPVYSSDGDFQLTTFAYINWYLEKALALMDINDQGTSAIANYTNSFTEKFISLKKYQNVPREKFKDFTYDDRVNLIPLFEDFELNDKAPVVSEINSYLNHIPISIAQTAQLSRLEHAANALFEAIYTYHYHIVTFAEALGQQLVQPINWSLYQEKNEIVQTASKEFVSAFKDYQSQFKGPLGERFSSSLKDIYDRHFVETDDALKTLYQGFFKKFAEFYNLPGQQAPKFEDYYRCFTEPLRVIK